MTVRRALLSVVACCSAAVVLSAQQPTFRARVDHVTIDVVVTDKNEVPVTGLTVKDFEVTEHDKLQTLADFTPIAITPRPEPVDLNTPPPPPRDVATNARVTDRSRAVIILINETRIDPGDIEQTRRVLEALIQDLTPDDQAALVYTASSNLSQDFTNDRGRLITAASHIRQSIQYRPPRDLAKDTRQSQEHFAFDNARAALEAATQPRKLLIFVDEFGVNGKTATDWIGQFEKTRQAGIPVYPIDPVATQVFQPPQLAHFQEPESYPFMAQATGGRDVLHPGDPVATAHDVMTENGTYYLLGYYPNPFDRDNKFHDVRVRIPSRPDLHVRAREGYWARTDKAAPDAESGLNKDLGAGLDDPGLPIQVFATPIAPADNGMMRTLVTTTVLYPPADAASPKLDDELRIGILALDADGGVKASHQRVVPLKGGASPGALTLVVDDVIDLPAKALTVRVGVSSKTRGRTGTAHLLVTVPDLKKRDVILGGVAVGKATPGALILNPAAITGLIPFHPTTMREFSAADTIRLFSRVFWPATGPAATIEATVRVVDSSITKTVTLTGVRETDHLTATLDTTLPLTGLAAGTHVIAIEARASNQTAAATRQVVVDIR